MRKSLVLAALATLLAGGTALAEPTFNRIATFQVPERVRVRIRVRVRVGFRVPGSIDGEASLQLTPAPDLIGATKAIKETKPRGLTSPAT